MTQQNPQLDIYGEPQEECFYCAAPFNPEHSTAPQEFIYTYCSRECYTRDMKQLRTENRAEHIMEQGKFKLRIPRE